MVTSRYSASKKLHQVQQLFMGLVLVLLLLSSGAAYYLSQRSQDTRQQASEAGGIVELTTVASPAEFIVNQPATLKFRVNTHDLQIDGVQLYLDVKGALVGAPVASIISASNLQLITNKVDPIDGGYQLKLIAIGTPGQPYTNNSDVEFVEVTFTPSQAGSINITFDPDNSQATAYKSTPVRDELAHIAELNYSVKEGTSTPTPTATPVSNVPTPTPVSDTGGKTPQACNGSCFVDEDCVNNLVCYNGTCRHSNNPTDSQCKDLPDTGIHNTCDQYCANTGECQDGLTCYFNRCRNPRNTTNASCAEPAKKTTTTTTYTQTDYTSEDENDDFVADDTEIIEDEYIEYDENPDESSDEELSDDSTIIEEESILDDEEINSSPLPESSEDTTNPLENIFVMLVGGLSVLAVLVTASVVYMAKRGNSTVAPILKTTALEHPIQPPASSSMSTFAGNSTPKPIEEQKS